MREFLCMMRSGRVRQFSERQVSDLAGRSEPGGCQIRKIIK